MPESVTVTPGTDWRNRKAQAGTVSSGRSAPRVRVSAGERLASRPPRSGSITQTGMPSRDSSSTLALAFWNSQSR